MLIAKANEEAMVYRIPPPHTPIPPSSHHLESSEQHKRTDRIEEFDLLKINIEQFILSIHDAKKYGNVFLQMTNLKELIDSNILNADQEGIIISEMKGLESGLKDGSIKVNNLYDRLSLFNTHLEVTFPKVKAFNIIQELKNNLCISPPDELPPMDIEEFKSFEKDILSFLRKEKDIENFDFRVNNLFNKLKAANEHFLYHPRRHYPTAVNQLKQIPIDIWNGVI